MSANKQLARVESIWAAAAAAEIRSLLDALRAADWELVQAALLAIRLHPRREYAEPILKVLAAEDKRDLYGQKDWVGVGAGFPFPSGLGPLQGCSRKTLDTWRCRWRLKQAACLALGEIGAGLEAQADAKPLRARIVKALCRYAASKADDYQVRDAACLALYRIASPDSEETLRRAAQDDEWCTATNAAKALAAIAAKPF